MATTRIVFDDPAYRRVLEHTSPEVSFTFLDHDTPADPGYFYYRVDNGETGGAIVEWTLVETSSATHTLTLPKSVTTIVDNFQCDERRQLWVKSGDSVTLGRWEFGVQNLYGVDQFETLPAPPAAAGLLLEGGGSLLLESGGRLLLG